MPYAGEIACDENPFFHSNSEKYRGVFKFQHEKIPFYIVRAIKPSGSPSQFWYEVRTQQYPRYRFLIPNFNGPLKNDYYGKGVLQEAKELCPDELRDTKVATLGECRCVLGYPLDVSMPLGEFITNCLDKMRQFLVSHEEKRDQFIGIRADGNLLDPKLAFSSDAKSAFGSVAEPPPPPKLERDILASIVDSPTYGNPSAFRSIASPKHSPNLEKHPRPDPIRPSASPASSPNLGNSPKPVLRQVSPRSFQPAFNSIPLQIQPAPSGMQDSKVDDTTGNRNPEKDLKLPGDRIYVQTKRKKKINAEGKSLPPDPIPSSAAEVVLPKTSERTPLPVPVENEVLPAAPLLSPKGKESNPASMFTNGLTKILQASEQKFDTPITAPPVPKPDERKFTPVDEKLAAEQIKLEQERQAAEEKAKKLNNKNLEQRSQALESLRAIADLHAQEKVAFEDITAYIYYACCDAEDGLLRFANNPILKSIFTLIFNLLEYQRKEEKGIKIDCLFYPLTDYYDEKLDKIRVLAQERVAMLKENAAPSKLELQFQQIKQAIQLLIEELIAEVKQDIVDIKSNTKTSWPERESRHKWAGKIVPIPRHGFKTSCELESHPQAQRLRYS